MNSIKLLYVDDEPINLMLFDQIFRKKFVIKTANSGFDALDILKSEDDFDVVISDMKMPGMNGVEFIKASQKQYPNLAYFILSGYEMSDDIVDALQSKLIIKSFKKPFNVRDILETIEKTVNKHI